MKTFQICFLLLASSLFGKAFACGFYPYGEEIRYCFFKPEFFDFRTYSEFNYSSSLFYPGEIYRETDILPNDQLWFDYCGGNVPYTAIKEAVYKLSVTEIHSKSHNALIQHLYRNNDTEGLNYLKFAKNAEYFNTIMDDPWERNAVLVLPKRAKLIDDAVASAAKTTNRQVKMRYLFQAIRLAYYNGNKAKIQSLYDGIFKLLDDKSALNYWSLYFRTLAETDKSLASFYAAQVYANAPEKRFMIYSSFDKSLPIQSILKHAKNDAERGNIYVLAAVRTPDRALDYMKLAYQYNPHAEGTSFLFLREINKIEDWVLTPYYSLFSPSTQYYEKEEDRTIKAILKRVERDRQYARQVLQFAKSVKFTNAKSTAVWEAGIAHLQFMIFDYNSSLLQIQKIERRVNKSDSIYNQLQIIKALNLTANQKSGNAIILDQVKEIILRNKHDKKFLFAIGRELEYNGNSTDAALLYSKLADEDQYSYVQWKTKKHKTHSYRDYFSDYFDYVDVYYSVPQVEALIADVVSNPSDDAFSEWKYSTLKKEASRMYDLLGTKYIRLDNLQKAQFNFNKVDNDYWRGDYSLWGNEYNANVFDQNPFFEIKYTPDFIPSKENFIANKATVTDRLIHYLKKANNSKEKNRDYYYFLVANCYYNMTFQGNSWMMRRFGFSEYDVAPFHVDEKEFREGLLAEKYYLKAYNYAKNDKFAALCLRLANRPIKLRKEFPDDYYPLYNGCTYFEDYFKTRALELSNKKVAKR